MRQQTRRPWGIFRHRLLGVFGVALVLATSFVACSLNKNAVAATTSTINFQARLMNGSGSIVPDGDYNVEFKLYNALTSSGSSQGSCTGDASCLWTETRTSTNVVRVANGYLTVNLGSVTSFPTTINWDQQLYLTMNIGGTGTPTWDGEMSPRLLLTGVPYAFRAGQLASLAGTHTGVLQFAASLAQESVITLPDPGASTATVCYQNSTSCGFTTSSSGAFIQNGTTIQSPGNFAIRSSATGSIGGLIQGANGQAADLFDLQTWNGTTATTVFGVSNIGVITLGGGQTTDITTPAAATATGVTLQPGTSSGASSNGGAVTIKGGNASGTSSVVGGAVTIQGGNATGGSGTRVGGSVSVDAGTGSAAAANGTVSIGAANALSVALGGTSATSLTFATSGVGRVVVDASNNLFLGNANASGSAAAPNAFTVSGTNSSAATVAGAALTIQGGAGNTTGAGGLVTLQGGASGAGAAATGGGVTIQGGSATGSGASNGGTVTIQGGSSTNGLKGLIQLNGGTYFTTGSYSSGSSATITQSLVDSNSAILATATAGSLTFTVPSPGITTAGRVLYITNVGSNSFTLSFGSSLSLNAGATATLIWGGSAWTGAGADSATLQNDYANSTGGTTPELLLDSTRNGLDIQDNSLTSGTRLLAVRATATASTLGSPLFVVDNTGKVGIGIEQPTRSLDISVNSAVVGAQQLLVEQAGAGDIGLEFKNPSKNFYTGIDASDGQFKISSAAAGAGNFTAPSTIPDHAGTFDSGNANMVSATKVTTGVGNSGTLSSITVYIGTVDGANPHMKVALYDATGASGGPGAVMSSSGAQTLTPNSWNTFTLSGSSIAASTTYWIAFNVDGAATQYGESSSTAAGNAKYTASGTNNFASAPFPGSPTITTTLSIVYSIYMTVAAGGGSDNFNSSLFSLSDLGSARFANTSDTNTAFRILRQGGNAVLTVDTTANAADNGVLTVGSATADANQTLLQVDSFNALADTATCSTTTNQGALYYNADAGSNSMRACVNGSWKDLTSTADAGFLLIGVVDDSGSSNVGDIGGISAVNNGPCKVARASTTSVTVNPCVAYSGGRKVVVASTTVTSLNGNTQWYHICLNGTDNQPTSTTANASETASVPAFSPTAPILCIADVKTGSGSTITNIYDTRVFASSKKEFTTINAAATAGMVVTLDGTNANRAVTTATANSTIRGVVAVGVPSASTTAVNGIVVTGGYAYVKGTGTLTVGQTAQTSTVTGYALSAAVSATAYANVGFVIWPGSFAACNATTNCQNSMLVDVNIR